MDPILKIRVSVRLFVKSCSGHVGEVKDVHVDVPLGCITYYEDMTDHDGNSLFLVKMKPDSGKMYL